MYPLKTGHAPQYLMIRIFEAADHITPKTDVAGPTITVSKEGGDFGVSTATLSPHKGGGSYWLSLPEADLDLQGGRIVWRIEALGADDAFAQIWMRAITEADLAIQAEYQKGIYASLPRMLYWDPVNGNDGNDGMTIFTPRLTFASLYTLAEANRHDVLIILPGQTGGLTTIAEQINLNKAHTSLRGPGRDVSFTPITDGSPTIAISAVGIFISGFLVNTAGVGNEDAIKITSDFGGLCRIWVDYARGNGINIAGASRCRINNTYIEGAGAGGVGNGLLIDGSTLAATKNFIQDSGFMSNAENGCLLKGTNALGNYFFQDAFLSNGGYGLKEETGPNLNIVRDCSFAANVSGDTLLSGSASKVENAGDIATQAADKTWKTSIADGTFLSGTMGYWFYKFKHFFFNKKDAGVTTVGEETVFEDDDITPSMSGVMKKASGASWTPPVDGVAIREKMV